LAGESRGRWDSPALGPENYQERMIGLIPRSLPPPPCHQVPTACPARRNVSTALSSFSSFTSR
jgi:hypothetical protein